MAAVCSRDQEVPTVWKNLENVKEGTARILLIWVSYKICIYSLNLHRGI